MTKTLTLILLILSLMVTSVAAMQTETPIENDELGDEEFEDEPFDMQSAGFEEVEQTVTSDSTVIRSLLEHPLITPAHFTYRHESAYGIENPKQFVINRSSLRLQWEKGQGRYYLRFDGKTDVDFVYNRSEFAGALKDTYRNQSEIREFYLQASEGPFSLKLGHQLVIWGKADGGVVTDIMSPRDLTELVFTSVEDARIGQSMLVADMYLGSHNNQMQHQWSLIINPDIKVNEFAQFGHPYSLNIPSQLFANDEPDSSLSNPEVGIRWNVTIDKVDLSLMAAEVHEDTPVLQTNSINVAQGVTRAIYPRYQMLGGGFNWGKGGFVWKGEIAFKKNRQFNRTDRLVTSKQKVLDAALGFDYNANGAYTFSLEISNQHLLDWDRQLFNTRRDESVLYVVWNKTWLNETFTTQYTSSAQLQDGDSFHRLELQYEISDSWSTELQFDYFDSDDDNSILGILQDKHRVSIQIDFDF